MTKILIKSFKQMNRIDASSLERMNGTYYCYHIFLDSDSIQWSLYTFAFDNIFYNAFNIYNKDLYPLDYYQNDFEMTNCFCMLINRVLSKNVFEIGTPEECIYPFKSFDNYYKRSVPYKRLVPLISIDEWTSVFKPYVEIVNDLKSKFSAEQLTNWHKYEYGDYDEEKLYHTSLLFNRYRYSLFIEYLINNYNLNIDDFIPMINSKIVFGETGNGIFGYPYSPKTLFGYDIYPLDLAYLSNNSCLLRILIQKGATKCSYLGNVVCFILDKAESIEDIESAKAFIYSERTNLSRLFKIDGNYFYNMDSLGRNILMSWYGSLVRIGNIEHLKKLLSQYTKQIFVLLNQVNPYTGKSHKSNENLQNIISTIPNSMLNFLNENIIPKIKEYKFVDTSYKTQGIWGYDAVTGAPIRESDLYIQ